jgi:hypothetical protein
VSKNPVLEFFRQQGATASIDTRARVKDELPVIGRRTLKTAFQAPFSYRAFTMKREDDVVGAIKVNPHPTDILADASLWAPQRLDLVRRLLIETQVKIVPEVRSELEDIRQAPDSPMRRLIFPEDALNLRVKIERYDAVKAHQYVMTRYTNLLHVRKRLLEGVLHQHEQRTGAPARGSDRHKIMQRALKVGISQRTLRLANKGDVRRRYSDEVLAVYGVLSPILTGRDCFILTADRDVFDQVYQFTVLLHDDYGSFLIARDYETNPKKYPHSHVAKVPYMTEGALAVGRVREPDYLLPVIRNTCATWVVDVNALTCFAWVGLREIVSALDFQEAVGDGRVADGGEGRNVHISGQGTGCSSAPAHFVIGHDVIRQTGSTPSGELRVSEFDLFRVCVDRGIRLP